MRRAIAIAVTVILTATGGYLYGQQQVQPFRPQPPTPSNIRTGTDIGFRVDQMKDNRALVTLMVRSKSGEWVEAQLSPHNMGLVPLESR
jgi:hypothetical protein